MYMHQRGVPTFQAGVWPERQAGRFGLKRSPDRPGWSFGYPAGEKKSHSITPDKCDRGKDSTIQTDTDRVSIHPTR